MAKAYNNCDIDFRTYPCMQALCVFVPQLHVAKVKHARGPGNEAIHGLRDKLANK